MTYLTLKDGTSLYYKDWGNRSATHTIVFSHGWPLTSDNWEAQMFFFANEGYRVVAHDRRGHGRSSQPWEGNDVDTWTDDLYQLIEHLDLKNIMLVGHSTGGGEIARLVGRHGASRVSKAVLISAITPQLVKSDVNPEGVDVATIDGFRTSMINDRAQFFFDVPTGPFFGFNRPGAKVSQGMIYSWWQQGMISGLKAVYDTTKSWERDYTEDLKKMNFPVLVLHGDDDQVAPIAATGLRAAKILPKGTLKVYKGGPHALPNILADEVNKDLLEFLKA